MNFPSVHSSFVITLGSRKRGEETVKEECLREEYKSEKGGKNSGELRNQSTRQIWDEIPEQWRGPNKNESQVTGRGHVKLRLKGFWETNRKRFRGRGREICTP